MKAPALGRALGRVLGRALPLGLLLTAAPALGETTAFFYGSPLPRELFQVYDQVVVQPDQAPNPRNYAGTRGQPVAYVSVGEVAPSSSEARQIRPGWVLAHNAGWSTWVLDPREPEVRRHVLGRINALWQRGYRRFFLDTLDSYRLGLDSERAREQAAAGWIQLIRTLAERHPDARWILNRGFELLPEVSSLVDGVVAESLFDGWDPATRAYAPVSAEARQWLLQQLQTVRERYDLPVTVIDYRPAAEREAARLTAQRIAELGFEPWVADHMLDSLGVGVLEVLPRSILILTDDPPGAGASGARVPSEGMRLLAPVIEHLGYVPVEHRLAEGLPAGRLSTRFVGLVSWLSSSSTPKGYASWLLEQIHSGLHVALFGALGLAPEGPEARALGIGLVRSASVEPTRVVQKDALIGFEAAVPARPFDGPLLSLAGPAAVTHLRLEDASGRQGVAAASCAWGGLAPSHVLALQGLAGQRSWVLDPFTFLERALALPRVPQPDLSTENGRRIALSVIRGAGLSWAARLPGAPATASALKARILERYQWPHEIDLEAAAAGPSPSAEDRRAAQQLFESPLVRPASAALQPGTTDLRREQPSLTQLEASARATASGFELVGPIASDLHYLPPGGSEAYPYARVLETLEATERPRRLSPILLDYHAFLASSPGGLATLDELYRWVDAREPYWLSLEQYRARVAAFREQVVARHLDGSVSYHGGDALRTVRLAHALGTPDLRASCGVAVLRSAEQAQYLTFGPGSERRLAWAASAEPWPHLTDSNGAVRAFSASASAGFRRVDFEIAGPVSLRIAFGGLGAGAACKATLGQQVFEGHADAHGRWSLTLDQLQTGQSQLVCDARGVLP